MIRPLLKYLVLLVLVAGLSACGDNQFKSLEKEDPAQDAANELERDNPNKAIKILEDALADDPNNPVLISLLSAAYAQKYEVGILDLALAMADSENSDQASNDFALLWPYLPEPDEENIYGVAYAVDLLVSIPAESRTKADNFKLALLAMASVSLRLKSFDTNNDGRLSTQELLTMSSDDASAIVGGVAAASQAVVGGIQGGENASKASDKITSISSAMDNAAGNSDEEKLIDYFANNQR